MSQSKGFVVFSLKLNDKLFVTSQSSMKDLCSDVVLGMDLCVINGNLFSNIGVIFLRRLWEIQEHVMFYRLQIVPKYYIYFQAYSYEM